MYKKIVIALVALFAVIAALLYWYSSTIPVPETLGEVTKYSSSKYSLSFEYPKDYFIVEHETGTGSRASHVIVIVPESQENRDLMSGKIQGTEGPPTITIQTFQNNLDHYTTEKWVRGTNDSNFKLSPDGKLAEAQVGGENALQYRWAGLYEGITVATARPEWVYAFSVSYNQASDQIVKDFVQILTTTKFTPAQ